jgi:hypothetical protein
MRVLSVFLTVICCTLSSGPAAIAQQPGSLTAEQRDIGRVETHLQKYDQALGVVSRLTRPLGAETECSGICFYPSSSQAVSWRCAPNDGCDLHCDVKPPVGGCH